MKARIVSRRAGFTLVEVAVATAIIGIGVVAMLTALAASTRANGAAQQLTQAVFLAQEIREWTLKLPFQDPDPADSGNPPGPDGVSPQTFVDDLDDLCGYDGQGTIYSPPIDGSGDPETGFVGNRLYSMIGWSQKVTLSWREESDLMTPTSPGASDVIYVEVEILNQGKSILTTGWLVTRR